MKRKMLNEVDEGLFLRFKELARRNHRTFVEELEHAMARHLASPPTVVVTTPELADVPPAPRGRRVYRRRTS